MSFEHPEEQMERSRNNIRTYQDDHEEEGIGETEERDNNGEEHVMIDRVVNK